MHALETARGALRPMGVLLDLRPAPQNPWVSVQRNERVTLIGQVDDTYRMGTLAVGDAALQTLITAGRLVSERTETFAFNYHFDSVESWLAYMAEKWNSAHVDGEVVALLREELAREPGEVVAQRAIRAERLRRL